MDAFPFQYQPIVNNAIPIDSLRCSLYSTFDFTLDQHGRVWITARCCVLTRKMNLSLTTIVFILNSYVPSVARIASLFISDLQWPKQPYLLCLCVWCCWPPSGSPGVFCGNRGDQTPCAAVDCDDADWRKSRFAALPHRPSFFMSKL